MITELGVLRLIEAGYLSMTTRVVYWWSTFQPKQTPPEIPYIQSEGS